MRKEAERRDQEAYEAKVETERRLQEAEEDKRQAQEDKIRLQMQIEDLLSQLS